MSPIAIRDGQFSLAAMIASVSAGNAPLVLDEIRQNLVIGPSTGAHLRPTIKIQRQAARIVQSVDRARTTKSAPLRSRYGAPRRTRTGLRLELPRVFRIEENLDEASGNMKKQIVVRRTCLENADRQSAIFAQSIRQNASGRSRADDDVVEGLTRPAIRPHYHSPPHRW